MIYGGECSKECDRQYPAEGPRSTKYNDKVVATDRWQGCFDQCADRREFDAAHGHEAPARKQSYTERTSMAEGREYQRVGNSEAAHLAFDELCDSTPIAPRALSC